MKKKLFLICVILMLLLVLNKAYAYPTVYPKGLTIDEPSKTYDGYTIFKHTYFDERGKPTGEDIDMIDMEGNVVHKWENVGYTLHYDMLDNGHIVYGLFLHQCPGGGCPINGEKPPVAGNLRALIERDWDNNIVWTYENDHLHHDVDVLPNGNIIATFYTELPKELNEQVKGGISGTEAKGGIIYTDIIRMINRNGDILWEWVPYKQLNISDYPLNPLITRNHWPYVNHAKYLPEGNPFNGRESVLISMRLADTLLIVDMETKKVVWEWGKGELSQQHEPLLLDNGNILVFDNNNQRKQDALWLHFSEVVEVNPKTSDIVWAYYGGEQKGSPNGFLFFTPIGGFIQRLPNGNTLISECWGGGRIFEVTPEKEIVWEYVAGINGITTIQRYKQSEVNWTQTLPPARPTGKPLGGRKIVGGREIIEKTPALYLIISIVGWVIALGCLWVLVAKIKRKKEKDE